MPLNAWNFAQNSSVLVLSYSDAPQRILGIWRDWSLQEETWKLKWSDKYILEKLEKQTRKLKTLKTFRTTTNPSGGPWVISSCAESNAGFKKIAQLRKNLKNMNWKYQLLNYLMLQCIQLIRSYWTTWGRQQYDENGKKWLRWCN